MNTKEKIKANDILNLALEIGKGMLKNGSEIARVEESIVRICTAYGLKKVDVFSITSMILISANDEDEQVFSQFRRVYSYSSNFDKLDKLNSFCRQLCTQTPDIDEALKNLEQINSSAAKSELMSCLGGMLATSSFAMFFGGSVLDALATMPIAILIYFMNKYIKKHGINRLFYTALTSIISGFIAVIFVYIGFGNNYSLIMIGDIMLMIPGLTLINSIREMLCGDTMSGFMRLAESILLSMAIAFGFALPILVASKVIG